MLVELKNGDTYNGRLVSCDTWMNITLRDVICTSRVRLCGCVWGFVDVGGLDDVGESDEQRQPSIVVHALPTPNNPPDYTRTHRCIAPPPPPQPQHHNHHRTATASGSCRSATCGATPSSTCACRRRSSTWSTRRTWRKSVSWLCHWTEAIVCVCGFGSRSSFRGLTAVVSSCLKWRRPLSFDLPSSTARTNQPTNQQTNQKTTPHPTSSHSGARAGGPGRGRGRLGGGRGGGYRGGRGGDRGGGRGGDRGGRGRGRGYDGGRGRGPPGRG